MVVPRGAVVFGAPAHVRMASGELREVTLGACDAQACAVDERRARRRGGAARERRVPRSRSLALALAGCARAAAEMQLVDVKRDDLVIGVEVTGELAAVDSTDIKPPPHARGLELQDREHGAARAAT